MTGDPNRCTCWREVYDLRQRKAQPAAPAVRTVQCEDCAYRPNSPERNGDPKHNGSGEGELDDLVIGGQPFYCHQGIRRSVKLRHPTGLEVADHAAAYRPVILEGVPYKANGKPAEICAGWSARRLRYLWQRRTEGWCTATVHERVRSMWGMRSHERMCRRRARGGSGQCWQHVAMAEGYA